MNNSSAFGDNPFSPLMTVWQISFVLSTIIVGVWLSRKVSLTVGVYTILVSLMMGSLTVWFVRTYSHHDKWFLYMRLMSLYLVVVSPPCIALVIERAKPGIWRQIESPIFGTKRRGGSNPDR